MTGYIGIGGSNPVHDGINSYGAAFMLCSAEPATASGLRKFAEALMSRAASACIAAGARDVSHIKAFIEHESGFIHADTVGDRLDVKVEGRDGDPVTRFRLVVNSVIFGLTAEAVREATETALAQVLADFGFRRSEEK